MTRYPVLAPLILLLASLAAPRAQAEDPPPWFKKKVQIQQQREAEEAAKAAEKPIVGGSEDDADGGGDGQGTSATPVASNLTGEDAPVDDQTLFRSRGLTDSLGLDYGTLRQPVIDGKLISAQYGLGWWWTPRLTLGGFARAGMMLKNEYLFMLVSIGPQVRYFLTRNLAVTGFAGYGFSQGLSRVPTTHIPPPPSETELRARRGLVLGGQIAWMIWIKRDLALGPAINYWRGTQGERTFSMVTVGVTYQAGKPNLTGSVVEDY